MRRNIGSKTTGRLQGFDLRRGFRSSPPRLRRPKTQLLEEHRAAHLRLEQSRITRQRVGDVTHESRAKGAGLIDGVA
jgi:hypothetical protein